MQPATEPLVICPCCSRAGFTLKGLRAHYCKSAPVLSIAAEQKKLCAPRSAFKRRLTEAEVRQAKPVKEAAQ